MLQIIIIIILTINSIIIIITLIIIMMQADSPVSLAKVDATKEKKVDTFNIVAYNVFNGEQVNRFPRWGRGSKLRGFQR